MTQVNLLPPEIHTRQRVRRHTAAAVGAVAAAVVLVGMVFFMQSAKLSDLDGEVVRQEGLNAGIQAKIGGLQHVQALKQELATRQQLVDDLLEQQVLWSSALRKVSSAVPEGLWTTSLNGSLTASATGATGTTTTATGASNIVGNIQFSGSAFDHPTVASWLDRLEQIPGWVNAWVTQSAKQQQGEDGRRLVSFTNSVDFTTEATVDGRPK